MKMQGEFRLRLRTLEKLLLQALNESSGNILDDDKVIDTLETLKREAAEITRKVEETDVIMKEVETVTAEYLPLAHACSAVFFILEQLNLVNHFYQFSLRFFLDIFDYVLRGLNSGLWVGGANLVDEVRLLDGVTGEDWFCLLGRVGHDAGSGWTKLND